MNKEGYLVTGPSMICGEQTVYFAEHLQSYPNAPKGAIDIAINLTLETGNKYEIVSFQHEGSISIKDGKPIFEETGNGFDSPRCGYCKKTFLETKINDGEEMGMFQTSAPGVSFIHWDMKKQKGCKANINNYSPFGQKVKPE